MSEKKQENQQDDTPKKVEVSIPGKVSISYDSQPLADIVHAINEANTTQTQEEEINNRQNRRQADAQERANSISSRLFWTNLFMLAITICVFAWNIKGVDAATDAAKAAIKSDSISTAALQWDSIKSTRASYADSIKFQKQFDFAQKSLESSEKNSLMVFDVQRRGLDAQQKALDETKKEFNAQNRPFIQFADLKIDSLEENQKIIARFNFANTGKFPAQISYYTVAFEISNKSKSEVIADFEKIMPQGKSEVNQILTSLPTTIPIESTRPSVTTNAESYGIKNRIVFIYIAIDIYYMDYISKIKYFRSIIVKVSPLPVMNVTEIKEGEEIMP